MSRFFRADCFFPAFFVGIFLVYLFTPTPEIILRFPTPQNAGSIIYKDSNDVCYKYKANPVPCPKEGVIETNLQHHNVKQKNKGILEKIWT